ncbi:hypothetical protein [Citrobacter farmeri]|uniref:hypothetical protein n=1 Tax=Citrobacter farmeri TaxID=67824 RepID=UPI00388F5074|nr:hypothetical protein [Citrobacter farmeri]
MTTITRERVAEIIHAAGLEPCDYEEVFGSIKTGEIVAMARIALASLTAEPVAYADPQSFDNFKSMGGKNAACTKEWMWRDSGDGLIPVYTAPPAPVVPTFDEWLEIRGNKPLGWVKDAMRESYDACRAAMLQGSQPVIQSDELPLDYLQGHKDGLEWAAQLAEANHPQTGDWLYDDPVDLAKAIRKGPDMPPVESGNSPVVPDGYALVPIEPTAEMYDAGDRQLATKQVWDAMIAAAPQQDGK